MQYTPDAAAKLRFMYRGVSALDTLTTVQWQTVLLAMESRHFTAGDVVVEKVRSSLLENCLTQKLLLISQSIRSPT